MASFLQAFLISSLVAFLETPRTSQQLSVIQIIDIRDSSQKMQSTQTSLLQQNKKIKIHISKATKPYSFYKIMTKKQKPNRYTIKWCPIKDNKNIPTYISQMSSKKQTPSKQPQDDNKSDSSYIQSEQQSQFVPPTKNEITQAIYKKYNHDEIKEEEQAAEDMRQSEMQVTPQHIVIKIKNLDTGEEEQITNQEEEENFSSRVFDGLHKINQQNPWKNFWLHVEKNNQVLRNYCQSGMYDQTIKLIQQGKDGYPAEINCKGLDDWRPIHFASYYGHDDIVLVLIKHGAEVNALAKFNRNPLHIASIRGNLQVAKILCENKVDINAGDNDGNTPLHFACQNGYKEIIKYLISLNCNIVKNKDGNTQIDECCDESLKKIFTQYGFKQKGDYDEYNKNKEKKIVMVTNKGQSITPEDFIYYKMLGKGSFGEVFLVKKKGDKSNTFFAMKVLSKDKILGKNLKRYALTQRNVMSVINHPFMVKLHYAFQTPAKLFLVMEYYPGGDLGKLITKRKSIPEIEARNYIAELILAFEALHKNMIVFRDLKPDNVVLDSQGHCRLTDFGLSKQGIYNNTTDSFCGSVAYLAPEILQKQGHSRTVDWYLVGLLLYELIVGLPPYYNSKKEILFENIKRGPLKIPKNMSTEAKDLIKKLLCRDPKKRLGNLRDSEQLKQHPFFEGLNWQDVFNRKLPMPPVDIPKINQNETLKISFNNTEQNKKVEGWTFVNTFEASK